MSITAFFFSTGFYVALGAACIANLRITPEGPRILIGEGGYPFLYEIGIISVLVLSFINLLRKKPVISKSGKLAILGVILFYLPIFFNFFVRGFDSRFLIGTGDLRNQLELFLFGIAMVIHPLDERMIRRAMSVVVLMALANSLFAITCHFGLMQPLYFHGGYRKGFLRQSGFFEYPGYLGILSAITIAYALSTFRKKLLVVIIFAICFGGVIVSDSRTGIVATLIVVAAELLSYRRNLFILAISCLLLAGATFTVFLIPEETWGGIRPMSIQSALHIWYENPFGVPWGTFEKYNVFPGWAVSPHNLPAISLLYGGIFSFISVAVLHVWIFKWWLRLRGIWRNRMRLDMALVSVVIAIITGAWFEQVFQNVHAGLIFMVCFGWLSQKKQLVLTVHPHRANKHGLYWSNRHASIM